MIDYSSTNFINLLRVLSDMTKEYDWEETADGIIEDLHAFIDTESRFVEGEHELHEKLVFIDYVTAHLNERIPEDSSLHDLNQDIINRVLEMRELIEESSLHDLSIMKEEKHLLQHLEDDVKHRDWAAVKKSELKDEKKAIRLELHELKEIHKGFNDIMDLLQKSSVKSAIDKDLTDPKQKHDYEQQAHYYFVQIHRFASTYERIFRHLIEKEKQLFKRIKSKS